MSEELYPKKPLLLIDDEEKWLHSFTFTLEYHSNINNCLKCSDSRNALELLAQQDVSVVLLDLNMPFLNGHELLPMILEKHPEIPVIIVSGLNQIDLAVKCLKAGAYDYFVKTDEKEHVVNGIKKAISFQDLKEENLALQQRVQRGSLIHAEAFEGIITQSQTIHNVFYYLESISKSHDPVLIAGESGVGKELIAESLHYLCHSEQPMVAVNVAGLDDDVFSDTLFGHIEGAFNGATKARAGMVEKARKGILFLDEIGDLSNSAQIKLLRLLQEGEYFQLGSDVAKISTARIVCATSHDLAKKVANGHFREDLYYRLCSHYVHIPPLRERPEDISLLLDHYVEEVCRFMNKKKPTIPKELSVLLSTYTFPGNVRELRSMIVDAVSNHQTGKLSMEYFKRRIFSVRKSGVDNNNPASNDTLWSLAAGQPLPTFAQANQLLIDEAMARAKGNQGIAAKMLGVTRQALNRRLQKKRC